MTTNACPTGRSRQIFAPVDILSESWMRSHGVIDRIDAA